MEVRDQNPIKAAELLAVGMHMRTPEVTGAQFYMNVIEVMLSKEVLNQEYVLTTGDTSRRAVNAIVLKCSLPCIASPSYN